MIWLSLRAVSLHSSPAICVNLILSASPLSICFLFYFLSPLGMSIFVIIIFSPCAFVFSSFFTHCLLYTVYTDSLSCIQIHTFFFFWSLYLSDLQVQYQFVYPCQRLLIECLGTLSQLHSTTYSQLFKNKTSTTALLIFQ